MKEGRLVILTAEHVDMLNSLGFTWKLRAGYWYKMLDDLKEYNKRRGDCLVPHRYAPNPPLGRWVEMQRIAYKHMLNERKQSSLTKERIFL
eukprot:8685437-Ditylum_brightwellii.AAC.1